MPEKPLILIAEDDAATAAQLQETVSRFGYRIAGLAATGKRTVELAISKMPDVILMDIRLRGEVSGIQAVEEIHKVAQIPIVYLTDYNDETLLQLAKVTNAFAYLTKPVRERELRASLEMTLIKSAAERRLNHLNKVLRALRDISQLIMHEHDPQVLKEKACQVLVNTRDYLLAWIGETTEEDMIVHPTAYAGDHLDYLNGIKVTWDNSESGRGPTGTATRTQQAVAAHDLVNAPNFVPWLENARKHGFATSAAIPMINGEKFYGVLTVYADHVNVFDDEEMDLLKDLASDLAFGLKALEDESQRINAENALRESEDKYKYIFDYANIGKSITFASGEMQVNKAFTELLGYSKEEFMRRKWQGITHPEDIDSTQTVVNDLMAGKIDSSSFIKRYLHKNGSIIWVNVFTTLRRDAEGKPLYLMTTVTDISKFIDCEKL